MSRACWLVSVFLAASASASAQVRIAWDPNPPIDVVTAYVVGYIEVPALATVCPTDEEDDTIVAVTPATATEFAVSALAPGKSYCLRVYALNVHGRGASSNTVGPAAVPPACPITIQVLSWTTPVGIGARGRVDFTLAHARPVTRLQVVLGTQVVGEVVGVELRDITGIGFSVPRTPGAYRLFLRARDSACEATTTTLRSLVVQ